jgi:hypothetical protein
MINTPDMTFNKKQLLFIGIFAALGLIALQIPFTQLAGSNVKFTLFDFFGPIATGFLGTVPGVIAVLLMELLNFVFHGAVVEDAGTIIRFFPMLAGALYFGKKQMWHLAIPAIAIAAFIAHPIGRTVWYYSLYWLIPIVLHVLRDRSLLARSIGTTFTAHSVGGALWIYAFNLPAAVWDSLIPVVAAERMLFALGIAAAYLVVNQLLGFLTATQGTWSFLSVNPRYFLRSTRR